MSECFVVVGAGLCGAKAVETLRSEGFDGRVVLYGEESRRPYERPPLSKGILLGDAEEDSAYVHPESWYAEHDVELVLGTRVSEIDAGEKEVVAGLSRTRFDRLLLATGAHPVHPRIPGANADGVFYLRTLDDSERLRAAFVPGAKVAVVGAGWIGLETTAAARHHGAEVTVVEPAPTPLHATFGPEIGNFYADVHRDHGVDLRLGTPVTEIDTSDGRVVGITTGSGDRIDADVVVVGVGARPRLELAEAAGLDIAGGVVVDERLASSHPDIYAAGDVALLRSPLLGRQIRVEHWANALNGGPAAAKSMLGQDAAYDRIPYFYSDQYDVGMEFSGWVQPGEYDTVVYRGDPAKREFIAFWLAGGRLLAGMNVNVWDVTDPIQAMIRSRQPVDVARLTDPQIPLQSVAEG